MKAFAGLFLAAMITALAIGLGAHYIFGTTREEAVNWAIVIGVSSLVTELLKPFLTRLFSKKAQKASSE